MPKENKDMQNKIKYSIWDTRTNEDQPLGKERNTEFTERPFFESNTIENQD